MITRKLLAMTAASLALVGGIVVAGASPASADQTWVQSFQRSGPNAPCEAPRALDLVWQDGWTGSPEWAPAWEQWPNAGAGGWTCTRSITWAHDTPPPSAYPSAGCLQLESVPVYFDFMGGWSLPAGTYGFDDAACTHEISWLMTEPFVYAPPGWDPAALCEEIRPGSAPHEYGVDPYIYYCN